MIRLPSEYIARCAASFGDEIAFIDGERRPGWRELDRRSSRLAAAFQSLGLRKNDTVAILSHDHLEQIEHWYACLKTGIWRTGINWRYAPGEMRHILSDPGVRGLIVQANCVATIQGLIDELAGRGVRLIGFGGEHGLDLDYETLIAEAPRQPEPVALAGDDVALISYTSGSTGVPKGALLQQSSVRESLLHVDMMLGFRHEDIFLNPAPMAGAPLLCGSFSLVNGMTTVLPDADFEARRFLELVERHRVTCTVLVPTMLRRVVDMQRREQFDISSLRFAVYGAAPTPPGLIREAAEVLGCDLYQLYGGTEIWTWCGCLRPEDHRRAFAGRPALLESCGRPWVHSEYSVRDPDFRPVPVGEPGEIWIRTPTVMKEYLHRPEETAEALREGWLSLGDIGREDEQGYYYLLDRRKFKIISGGYNVYPAVVENVLYLHDAVHEAVVVGVPHPEWGEVVAAVVTLHPGRSVAVEELIDFCRDKVGKWEVPKHLEIADDLPRGSTGKLQKREVRDRLMAAPERFGWNQPVRQA